MHKEKNRRHAKQPFFVSLILTCFFCSIFYIAQADEKKQPLLVISSYNPETAQTATNISEFLDEYRRLDGQAPVTIESMNCRSFPEAALWKKRMRDILLKYSGPKKPIAILLLGQEAWASYISQDSLLIKDVPIICGMVSKNAILLPNQEVELASWEPQSINVVKDITKIPYISGFVYNYDIPGNVRLIQKYYPGTRNIAFISDNTYGGVALQALVKKEMKRFPNLNLILLDGRQQSIYSIIDKIEELPPNTAILLGTWRVDMNEGYFMRNATYSMMAANLKAPAFSITSVGMGHWAIGGLQPVYRSVGKDLAQIAIDIQSHKGMLRQHELSIIPNQYVFDAEKLKELKIDFNLLPSGSVLKNKEVSLFEKYQLEITSVIIFFIILLLAFSFVLFYSLRTKRLKDALLISEASNKLILNNINSYIHFIGPDYRAKWHNNTKDTSGKSHCYEIFFGKSAPCENCPVVEAINRRTIVTTVIEQSKGEYYNTVANPVYSGDGKLLGVVVRSEDVTRQKEAEIELRYAKEKAEESDRLKSKFLANMSHEIRTPLNAIVGFSEVMSLQESTPEEQRDFARIIKVNSDLLLRLINDILDISRLETGKIKLTFAEQEIISLSQKILATVKSCALHPDVQFVFESTYDSFMLNTDAQRLQQILINLLNNANKFTQQGDIKLSFWVNELSGSAMFAVSDTGCGIPKEMHQKVFERFEKLDEYAQGTGLGLSICKMTIQQMGGNIWIDNNYTNGTRFVISHPISDNENKTN